MQEKMKNISDISERLQGLIRTTGNNPNSFAKKLGYDRSQAVYDMINGKAQPSYDFFKRLKASEYSDISIDEVFFNSENIVSESKGIYLKNLGVPIIPYSAIAGINGYAISVMEHEVTNYINLPFLKEKGDFAFKIEGDSMSPKYHEGCYVICKKIELSELKYDNVYLICIDHSPMLKRILPSDNGYILCRSDNPTHRDFSINKKNITAIAKVIACISL
jgi:phage repressor protein C with HTH and peptisase S24 domain